MKSICSEWEKEKCIKAKTFFNLESLCFYFRKKNLCRNKCIFCSLLLHLIFWIFLKIEKIFLHEKIPIFLIFNLFIYTAVEAAFWYRFYKHLLLSKNKHRMNKLINLEEICYRTHFFLDCHMWHYSFHLGNAR